MKANSLLVSASALLLALSSAAFAQTTRSGPLIGLPTTGTGGDTAGVAGSAAPRGPTLDPRLPESIPSAWIGSEAPTGGATAPNAAPRPLCESLTGDARARCLREQDGSAGPKGTGSGPGSTVPGR